MLRIQAQQSLKNAQSYFKEHLQVGDYYSEGNPTLGQWIGTGAEQLGLKGVVTEKAFLNIIQGLDPETGNKLTQRLNTVRLENGIEKSNRRLFYDFCIAPPKSVSLVGLMRDPQVVELHNRCVRESLKVMEKYAATRVRKAKQNTQRPTGNIVTALFQHETSRALDPLLHTHCVVMNLTYDPYEQKWKALENQAMLKAQKVIHGVYMQSLATGLQQLGYALERSKGSFEIHGISRELIQQFSKRTRQITDLYEQEKDQQPEVDPDVLKYRIAHEQRNRKIKNQTLEGLQLRWEAELSPQQRKELEQALQKKPLEKAPTPLEKHFDYAEAHTFERHTFTTKEHILATVLEQAWGDPYRFEDLERCYAQRGYLPHPKTSKITLKSVLETEVRIVNLVKAGKGVFEPFTKAYEAASKTLLSPQQASVIQGLLQSRDFATFFKGSAGTGKSHTLKALSEHLEKAGHWVCCFAPQRQQVLDLIKDGLEAQTVAQALLRKPEHLPTGVWIIDEAGQIGGKDMETLLRLAQKTQSRVIFSGDTKQHGAITASDALIALEQYAQIQTHELTEIRRQDPEAAKNQEERLQRLQYRQAVQAASTGNAQKAFARLEALGWVQELPKKEALSRITKNYLEALDTQKGCLILSQTHKAVLDLNTAVKKALQQAGRLGSEVSVELFRVKDWTLAQKQAPESHEIGDYLHFHRKYGTVEKGNLLPVVEKTQIHLFLQGAHKRLRVSLKAANTFTVCERQAYALAEGEQVLLKLNGLSVEGKLLTNGELVTFRGLTPEGHLRFQDGLGLEKTLRKDQALLSPGYALTSYSAQGKTVDKVLLYDSQNPLAIHAKEWYVSISRGREKVEVFTEDKEAFQQAIAQTGDRGLGLDVVREAESQALSAMRARDYGYEASEVQRQEKEALLLQQHQYQAFQERQRQREQDDYGLGY